jgi:type III secretory pathway lipoprotein EscJ
LEIRKLHNALEEMQLESDAAKALALKEQEANLFLKNKLELATNQSSALEESYVKIQDLTRENQSLNDFGMPWYSYITLDNVFQNYRLVSSIIWFVICRI